MHFLLGADFHARQNGDSLPITFPYRRGDILGCIVITDGNQTQLLLNAFLNNLFGTHIPVATGGQAGVNVEIGFDFFQQQLNSSTHIRPRWFTKVLATIDYLV
jgi:hypothetical protein